MAKQVTRYICQQCGAEFPKWAGKCNQCGEWNSLVETLVSKSNRSSTFNLPSSKTIKPVKLSQVKSKTFKRIKTNIQELDRVLGGGIVPGSLVLVAGQPGIGKSTLLTQLALQLTETKTKNKKLQSSIINHQSSVLYVCGEESPQQIKLRIKRFHKSEKKRPFLRQAQDKNLWFLPETNIENILSAINHQPSTINHQSLIIIDSIQTLWTERLTGSAGSVGQVRQCSQMLLNFAKTANIPIFLIGHITKEGMIAGPKVLEHLVDTVLYLEGDSKHDFRILRANKNRFGPTDEVGIFTMTDEGMMEVKNPSKIFLSHQSSTINHQPSGSAITVSMQGVRPILIEIQALIIPTHAPMPRRVASGIDYKRLQVLCAVLQKRLNIPLYQSDVFVNVAGGLKLTEPAADLAICLAIISSFKNKPLPQKSVCLGEVGLLGEIRKVSFMDKRIKEAKKLGFKTIIGLKQKNLRQTLSQLK